VLYQQSQIRRRSPSKIPMYVYWDFSLVSLQVKLLIEISLKFCDPSFDLLHILIHSTCMDRMVMVCPFVVSKLSHFVFLFITTELTHSPCS
jgi:hypothetical protein